MSGGAVSGGPMSGGLMSGGAVSGGPMSGGATRGLAPMRSLRTRAQDGRERLVFCLVIAAVTAHLTVSGSLLTWIGVRYDTPGGIPLVKLHLATYLTALAAALQVWGRRPLVPKLVERVAASPLFPLSIALMLTCAAYSFANVGLSGTAVYIETYISAALLGFTMERLGRERLRRVGYALLALCTLNALMCIGEVLLQRRLLPIILVFNDQEIGPLPDWEGQFRGTALLGQPLTGAMITMLAVFLCLAVDLKPALKAATVTVLLVALITFGGRTALAVAYALLICLGAADAVRRLAARRMGPGYVALALAAIVVVPALLAGILFETSLGERIAGKFYADDSATVRLVQWDILGQMDARDLLFGMDNDRLGAAMLRIGLDPPFNDIESFWLLSFVTLGATGFAVWLAGLLVLLRRLLREPGVYPRLILLSMLLVASGSNSLGRKSNILFVTVAAVMSAAAFTAPREARRAIPPPAFRDASLQHARSA